MDPATGATTTVESDPEKRVDIARAGRCRMSTTTSSSREYEDDRYRVYFKDKALRAGVSLAAVEAARQRDRFRRAIERREHLDSERE